MLEKWSEEEVLKNDDITKFAGELWLTVSDFEKDLKESLKGHEMVLAMKEHKYVT